MAGTGKEQSPEIVSIHHKVRVMDSQRDVNYTLSDVMREMKEFRADMYQKMDIIRQDIIANIDSKITILKTEFDAKLNRFEGIIQSVQSRVEVIERDLLGDHGRDTGQAVP